MSIYNDINSKLDELYEKIRPDELSWLEDAKKTFLLFIKFEKLRDFITILECVTKELRNDPNKSQELREVQELLKELQKSEPDFLIENLKRAGYALAQNKELREAINKESLKILEQVRLGKKANVIGMLMRNFTIRNIKIPPELIEALKPKYEINLFRAFIYAFLSGFITTEE
ncbi:hypothetical protein [Thermodesulfovibrio yellowstonii]|uniref:Uncharacterized protein n=1 Tax=Thermodesulfovibrio yellowstonii TaxID=28262 RepID=A0A9W6GEK2_9BACT|nr:hypothetical protein [Thermodesulfovibrio islandicus]GLI52446.1 hypothetical protein TISLANDTSLP1_01390 [Thermodesulfovibrio islandicus]